MLGVRPLVWPLTLLNLCLAILGSTSEKFQEKLSINTLQDGKVATKFTFTTLLKEATPRDPRTLDSEDECAH